MQYIIKQINEEKIKLSKHDLISWIKSSPQPLTFVPAMTFFVLGFRDVLSYLKRPNPVSIWDHVINVHCNEDANHWIWFIEDLQKIGVNDTEWGKDFTKLLTVTWSEDGYASRDMIYSLTNFAKSNSDSFVNLAIIESLEAAFAIFIESLMPQIEKRGWQTELRYFGSRHHEDESNHALGSWVGEVSVDTDLNNVILSDLQRNLSQIAVSEIFKKFDLVFNSWLEQADKFNGRFAPIIKGFDGREGKVMPLSQADLSN